MRRFGVFYMYHCQDYIVWISKYGYRALTGDIGFDSFNTLSSRLSICSTCHPYMVLKAKPRPLGRGLGATLLHLFYFKSAFKTF